METNTPSITIENHPVSFSEHTVGELIKCLERNDLEDLIISIADNLVEKQELDFESTCFAFADYVAIGNAITDRIRELPSAWDGTSWLTLVPAEKDTVSVDQTGNTNALPLAEIACARFKSVLACDETDTIRTVMMALIKTVL